MADSIRQDPFGQPFDATVGVPLTYCADGIFRCGTKYTDSAANDGSDDCSQQKGGLYLVNGEPTTATPSPSAATAARINTPAPSPSAKPTNTGLIDGGVVGVIVAVTILSLAFWYFMIGRNVE